MADFSNPTQSALNLLILKEPFGLLPTLERALPQVRNWSDVQNRKQTNSGFLNFLLDNTDPSLSGDFVPSADETATLIQFGFSILISLPEFQGDPRAFIKAQLLAADYRKRMVSLADEFRSSNGDRELSDLFRSVDAPPVPALGGVRGRTILSQAEAKTAESGNHFINVRVGFLIRYLEANTFGDLAAGFAAEGMLPGA